MRSDRTAMRNVLDVTDWTVTSALGRQIPVRGVREVDLALASSMAVLRTVLLVSDVVENLISVSALAAAGFSVHFEGPWCAGACFAGCTWLPYSA